jgi:quinol monooxygenase YgiN
MTGSLIVVALGAVVAAAGTGVLTARCARAPRLFLIAWTAAIFALTVAMAAQALGYLSGFTDPIFRAMEIGAQAVAPLALCLGLVELNGRSIVSRFTMRLAVAAIGVIVLVILGTDPLSPNITLGKSWPDPAAVYQLVPVALIKFLAVFTLLTALGCLLAAGLRARRGGRSAAQLRPVLGGAGAAVAVALSGVAMLAGDSLGSIGSALAQLATAALIWSAVLLAGRAGLIDEHLPAWSGTSQDRRSPVGDDWPESLDRVVASYSNHDEPEDPDSRAHPDDYRAGAYGSDGYQDGGSSGDGYHDARYDPRDTGIGNPALAALAAEPDGPRGEPRGGYDGRGFDSDIYTGAIDAYSPGSGGGPSGRNGRTGHDAEPSGPLFGQITIYTVLDERIDDFDRMTEQVVEQVRASEPGTLVYIAHAVPTAPMQRILYEVYSGRTAYEDHLAQPYVARFESERRAMVLAINSIELGLQQAKVSPLPSFSAISDILSESGIDLTGVTEAGQRGAPGTGSPSSYPRSGARELPLADPGRYADEPDYDRWPAHDDGPYR